MESFKKELMGKYSDCAMLDNSNICTALIYTQCIRKDCPFYKSKKDYKRHTSLDHNGAILYEYEKLKKRRLIVSKNITRTSSGMNYNEVRYERME